MSYCLGPTTFLFFGRLPWTRMLLLDEREKLQTAQHSEHLETNTPSEDVLQRSIKLIMEIHGEPIQQYPALIRKNLSQSLTEK